VKEYIKKGTKVFVEGDLSVKSYKNTNSGNYEVGVNCRVRRIELLSSKKADEESTEKGFVPPSNQNDDDLPF
jgi:single-stranded DNA-binding protein